METETYMTKEEVITLADSDELEGSTNYFVNLINSNLYLFGLLMAVLNSFTLATTTSMNKLTCLEAPMMGTLRAVVLISVAVTSVLWSKQNVFGEKGDRLWLFLRCIATCEFIVAIFSVKFIPVTEFSVIMFTSPIFTLLLAWILLKESAGFYEVVMVLTTITGVMIVVNPVKIISSVHDVSTVNHIIGCSLAAVKAVLMAFSTIIIRRLKHIHFSVLMFWQSLPVMAYCVTFVFVFDAWDVPESPIEIIYVVVAAIAGCSSSFLKILSLRYAKAGHVSIVRCSTVVFAALYQLFLFQHPLTTTTIIGSVIICFSIVLIKVKGCVLKKLAQIKKQILTSTNVC